eukprot:scaffold6161_cov376-Prasinococcus_capsulatus_cf.AAC.1
MLRPPRGQRSIDGSSGHKSGRERCRLGQSATRTLAADPIGLCASSPHPRPARSTGGACSSRLSPTPAAAPCASGAGPRCELSRPR